MLTAQQIERMRATVDDSLPDTITIQRLVTEDDGGGGLRESWVDQATIPARVGLPLGGETDERNVSRIRLADELLYTVWMTAGTDIRQTDRVLWDGREFEVVAVLERGNWELTRRARIKEL